MTMPNERRNADNRTRIFLLDLMDPKKTPRVPKSIRKEAASCLRHYPGEYYMLLASEQAPRVFGEWNSGWPDLDLESDPVMAVIDKVFEEHGK